VIEVALFTHVYIVLDELIPHLARVFTYTHKVEILTCQGAQHLIQVQIWILLFNIGQAEVGPSLT